MSNQATSLVRDAVDLHVHSSPCLFARWGSDSQLVREADANGMRAIMLKSHFESTVGRAAGVSQAGRVRVLGGLVLNPFLGGITPDVVDVACRLGARMIWMPTLLSVPPSGPVNLACLKIKDSLRLPREDNASVVKQIAATIAAHDVVLASGHLSAAESLFLFETSREAGLAKLIFTHPLSPLIEATDTHVEMAVQMGVKIEIDAFDFVYGDQSQISRPVRLISRLGAENFFLSSDGGQAGYPNPCASLRSLARLLAQAGIPSRDLEMMMRVVPAALMGLA
jgi:Family of unknown function (DUF6282)